MITLTAVQELLNDRFEATRVLVVAPLRVAQSVWATEAAKWDHLRELCVIRVLGSAVQREAALAQSADVYVINRENLPWLATRYTPDIWPFDMVVLDELSSFKSHRAERFKALRRMRPGIRRVVGLTGTPAPNGLLDLWAQVYLLDRGQRLGRTLGGYRERYFNPGKRNGHVVYDWTSKPEAPAKIYGLLEDLCVSMKGEDYLELPPRMDLTVPVALEPAAEAAYREMEKEAVLALGDSLITATTAGVVAGKLLQLANGAVYDEDRKAQVVHDAKLRALAELVEAANGKSVLVYYAFQHDLRRIQKALSGYQVRVLGQGDTEAAIAHWNRGETQVLLAHPDSAGHGLNLQEGGCTVIWFGLTWSLEKYQQANARLYRQGQTRPVTIYHILARDTIDERVMRALGQKEAGQNDLMEAVKARFEEVRHGKVQI